MAKEKRATWWKMFSHQRAAIEAVSDADAGQGLKAAFRYFDGDEVEPDCLTPQAFIVLSVIRPYIDEAKRDYEVSAVNGRKGAAKRWNSPPMGKNGPPMGSFREAEAEAEAEAEGERGDKPPRAPRFTPPSVEDVRAYCRERGNGIDAERFCDFYASNGWKVGKNTMKDWRAAVRTWERRDQKPGGGNAMPTEADYHAGWEGYFDDEQRA